MMIARWALPAVAVHAVAEGQQSARGAAAVALARPRVAHPERQPDRELAAHYRCVRGGVVQVQVEPDLTALAFSASD